MVTQEQHFRAVCFLARLEQNAGNWAQQPGPAIHPNLQAGIRDAMNIGEQEKHSKNPLQGVEQSDSEDEARRIRRLQIMISMVSSVISQDPNLTVEEASELAAGAKRAALAMFPDKELAYDLLYKPRIQRLMRERFRLQ